MPVDPNWSVKIWKSIHSYAASCRTMSMKKTFPSFMERTIAELPCVECIDHAVQYVKKHPITEWLNHKHPIYGDDVAILEWSWRYHNDVNRVSHKPEMPFEDILGEYRPDLIAKPATQKGFTSKRDRPRASVRRPKKSEEQMVFYNASFSIPKPEGKSGANNMLRSMLQGKIELSDKNRPMTRITKPTISHLWDHFPIS